MNIYNIFWLGCIILICLQIGWMLIHRCFVKGMAFTVISGLVGIFMINFLGKNIALSIPISHATIAVSGGLGLPGCALILFLKLICLT